MRLTILKPKHAWTDAGGYILYGDEWIERTVTRSVIRDMAAVSDASGVLFLVQKYGRFFPPDVYPAGEPVETAVDWCQMLPAAITACQCVQANKPIPQAALNALDCRNRRGDVVQAVQRVFDDLLRLTAARPVLVFDREARRFDLHLASGPHGRVSCLLSAANWFATETIMDPADVLHIAECSLCHRLFEPARSPAAGRAVYCDRCRGSAAMWRAIKRRQRAQRR